MSFQLTGQLSQARYLLLEAFCQTAAVRASIRSAVQAS